MAKYKHLEKELRHAVNNSKSIANVCRMLGIIPAGGNYKTLHNKFKIYNIDTSHFTGIGWNTGMIFKPNPPQPLVEILVEKSTFLSGTKLKNRLFVEGLKENKCEICNISEWNGKSLICELDHINGINMDNRIENLRILCPNCHSQTPNFRGRNKLKIPV